MMNFAETCGLLWRHAQINLLDVAVDEAGVLTPSFIILEPIICLISVHWQNVSGNMVITRQTIMLARLQMPDNTRPLLLGNIANLFFGRMDSCGK